MIYFGLHNYYGSVTAYKNNDKFYMGLEDYDGTATIEISSRFYKEIEREFSKKE